MKRRQFLVHASATIGTMAPFFRVNGATPCPPATLNVAGGTSASAACGAVNAEADWLARSRAPGVVWAHDFRSNAEVNNFRWSSGVGGGNDPQGLGNKANLCRRITTDGVTGGGCLEVVREAGTSETGSVWWRPFSPMVGTGNGRGIDDPGAGILPPQPYASTQGGSQIAHWGLPRSARRGIYCHPQYGVQGQTAGVDGHDFYLQMRIKVDPRRKNTPAVVGGKLLYLTHTWQSYTDQEIITYSYGGGSGGGNPFRMYRGAQYLALEQAENGAGANRPQVGSAFGSCHIYDNPAGCWNWSGGWDTVLYHVTPGVEGVANQRIEVWVCTAGQEANGYVKIWDQAYDVVDHWPDPDYGFSAMICGTYNNGLNILEEFYHRYDQIIFSKQFIPCPLV